MTLHRLAAALMAAVIALAAAAAAKPPPFAKGPPGTGFDRDPVIFVHGSSGSAAQFSAQAQRFSTVGYPDAWLSAVEYDSAERDIPAVLAAIDAEIDRLQALTGREDVVLMGHSLGTFISQTYLSDPARAADVSAYVNIDGRPADSLPGGVPTLALWAGAVDRDPQPRVEGGVNVTLADQEHIEVAVSPEAFAAIYEFLSGEAVQPFDPEPQYGNGLTVSGRAVIFPDNVGVDGATVEMWPVRARDGRRLGRNPAAVFDIDESGDFGPVRVRPFTNYEFVILRDGARSHHFFYEPFVRSDPFVRLNTSAPGAGIGALLPSSPDTVNVNVNRNYEFWGDRHWQNDVLLVDGVNVVNEVTAPSGFVGAPSTMFAVDEGLDGVTNTRVVPNPFPFIGFLSGADVFIPADAAAPLRVISRSRRNLRTRVVPARRLASDEARVTVQLRDY